MTVYEAEAFRWEDGWELHVRDVGVTQVRSLDVAPQQVRDLVETVLEVDARLAEVLLRFALPEYRSAGRATLQVEST